MGGGAYSRAGAWAPAGGGEMGGASWERWGHLRRVRVGSGLADPAPQRARLVLSAPVLIESEPRGQERPIRSCGAMRTAVLSGTLRAGLAAGHQRDAPLLPSTKNTFSGKPLSFWSLFYTTLPSWNSLKVREFSYVFVCVCYSTEPYLQPSFIFILRQSLIAKLSRLGKILGSPFLDFPGC